MEYEKYNKKFKGKNVIEIGTGLGFDAYTYLKKKFILVDINQSKLNLSKKL